MNMTQSTLPTPHSYQVQQKQILSDIIH